MVEYWGAEHISRRMGIARSTLFKWIDRQGFLAYPRPCGRGARRLLYTNEALIQRWEIARVMANRAEKQRRRAAVTKTPGVDRRRGGDAPPR